MRSNRIVPLRNDKNYAVLFLAGKPAIFSLGGPPQMHPQCSYRYALRIPLTLRHCKARLFWCANLVDSPVDFRLRILSTGEFALTFTTEELACVVCQTNDNRLPHIRAWSPLKWKRNGVGWNLVRGKSRIDAYVEGFIAISIVIIK